jgi:hypothetical protein
MEKECGYNGWKNFETWCVHLWLTNEEDTYRYWRDEARRHRDEAGESKQVKEWGFSEAEAARLNLAEQLRDEIEDGTDMQTCSLYTDILNAALGVVDWPEVADAFLEDLGPSEDGRPEVDEDEEEAYTGFR